MVIFEGLWGLWDQGRELPSTGCALRRTLKKPAEPVESLFESERRLEKFSDASN